MTTFLDNTLWTILFACQILAYGSYTILVRLSEENEQILYSPTSMNLTIEFFKLVISLLSYAFSGDTKPQPFSLSKSLLFSLPALLYFINNNLAVYIQLYMDSTSYQMLTNFKIFTTAIFYHLIMRRRLSKLKWFALSLLFCAGCLYVRGHAKFESELNILNDDETSLNSRVFITKTGLVFMLIYVSVSGLAGVYTEYILKSSLIDSIFQQNVYMYAYGCVFNLVGCLIEEQTVAKADSESLLFANFNVFTWLIVLTQVYNGLCMSFVMKYSNNITKLFVVSCSLAVTTVLSVWLFALPLNFYFYLVSFILIVAVYIYVNF